MKAGKRPTIAQRRFMKDNKLSSKDWLVTKDTPDHIEIVNRGNEKIKVLNK